MEELRIQEGELRHLDVTSLIIVEEDQKQGKQHQGVLQGQRRTIHLKVTAKIN